MNSLEYVVNQDYKKAESSFKYLIDKYPNSEVGYYLLSSIYATEMMDFEYKGKEKEFYETLKQGYKIVDSKDEDNLSSWDGYFKAGLKIVENGYKIRRGSVTAVFSGKSAMGLNNKFYAKDTNNADLAFYSGFYFYGMSKVWEKFSWMGADTKQDIKDAIKLLKKSENESIFSRNVSTQTLINIYFENGMYEKAKKDGVDFLKIYPENRAVKWAMAKMYKKKKIPKQAIKYYEELFVFFETVVDEYPYNYFNLCDEISELYVKIGDKESSKKYINYAIKQKNQLPKKYDDRIDDFVDNCEDRLDDME